MAKEIATRKGKEIGNYVQFIHGGNPVQDASKFICLIPQGTMATIPDKYPSTKRNYAFPRLQTIY